jgi:hypothetical protein
VIDGQQEPHISLLRFLQQLPRQFHLVGLQQRLADLFSLSLEEGIRHAAADDERVHLAHQIPNHANLVADFRPAQDRHKRRLRMLQRLAQILQLLFHEQAGRRF